MGQYDTIVVVEAPNDEVALGGLLQTAQEGYVRTEALRAFTEQEAEQVISRLG